MRRHGWLALACVLAGATFTGAQEKPALSPGAVARLGTSPLRLPERIFDTAFARDARTFVTICRGNKGQWNLVLFDAATGLERKRIGMRDNHNIAMARHKPLMVLIAAKGFEVWDLATDKLVNQWTYPDSGWRTNGLAMSPDGTEVVAALSQPGKAAILRFDATTGKTLPARYPPASEIRALSFSADGSKLLTASEETIVRVNDKITWIRGSIIAWDAKTGRKLAELPTVYPNIRFSPDGNRFARGTTGKSVEIIDIGTGKRLAEFAEPHGQFAFTPDSKRLLLMSGGQIRLWDIDAKNDVRPFEGASGFVARDCFSADGRLLAVVQHDVSASHVQFWDVATGKRLRFETSHPGAVDGLAYSPDGNHLATFSERTLLIFDVKTGKELHRWVGHKAQISQIAFSPDGKLLASASWGGTIGLWETTTGKLRHRLRTNAYGRALVFTRDGATLLAVNTNQSVQSWDVAKGIVQRGYEVPAMAVSALSPTGQLFAGFDPDATRLQFMNPRTGKSLPSIRLRPDGEFGGGRTYPALAFSADGKLLATSESLKTADHAVRVWETATRREIRRFVALRNATRLLAVSPDGRMLAHGLDTAFTWSGQGADAAVILRDIANSPSDTLKGEEKDRPIGGHHGRITCLAFSPDSKFIATGGSDQVVYIWRVEDFFKRPHLPEVTAAVAAHWPQLADADAGKAYQAIAQLERKPKETVEMLRKHLQPVPRANEKVVAKHLRDLSSASFMIRQQAAASLEKSGERAAHLLQEALKNPADLEMKRRLEMLLDKLDRPLETPGQIRVFRSLVLLERIGTPEARKLLQELSQGAPAAWLTSEARYSLKRLQGR